MEFATGILVGIVVGLVGSYMLALTEPIQRWLGRAGRNAVSDKGISVTVDTDPQLIWAGYPDWIPLSYFIEKFDHNMEPPHSPRAWWQWVRKSGGCDYNFQTIRLTIVGTAPVSVVVDLPIIEVEEARAPEGTAIMHTVGGADVSPRSIDVDLDSFGSQHPMVKLSDDGGEPLESLSWSFQKGEVQQILINICSSRRQLFKWKAKLPLIIDGRKQLHLIDDNGSPFTFVGGDIDGSLTWDGSEWSPIRTGP